MDNTFVPEKPSTLVVRVKIATPSSDDFLSQEPETEFNGIAIFILISVVLLIIGGGYFYFSSGSAEEKSDSALSISQNETLPSHILAPITITPAVITENQSTPILPETSDKEVLEKEITPEAPVSKPEELFADVESIVAPESEPEPQVLPKSSSEPANLSSIYVTRAQFTRGIQEREPIDLIEGIVPAVSSAIAKIFFFTELKNLKGQVIRHVWFHENRQVSEIKFNVRGNRWRVNSSKRLNHAALGSWQVKVMNEGDDVLLVKGFLYE